MCVCVEEVCVCGGGGGGEFTDIALRKRRNGNDRECRSSQCLTSASVNIPVCIRCCSLPLVWAAGVTKAL